MIDRYGDSALEEVDLRILELREQQQPEAVELWENIRETVKLLSGPSTDKSVH